MTEIMVVDRPDQPFVLVGKDKRVVILTGNTKLEEDIRAAHQQAGNLRLPNAQRKVAQGELEKLVAALTQVAI